MRWLKSKQFPAGTVIKQESSVARGVWIDLPGGEIGGKRRMSLVVQSSGVVSVEPYGAGAQYVVSPAGDQVKIVFTPDPESADDSQNFWLYRLFEFDETNERNPYFALNGSVEDLFHLKAVTFKARAK